MKIPTRKIPVFASTRTTAVIFSVLAAGIFALFLVHHPVDWIQPETLRLRYYGLQAGLRDGPLSASFNRYDPLKPLVWEAQGGMFDGRYPIMLFDALIPKFYQPFYSWWGPSLREPVNLILILLTWLLLVYLIREWFGSLPAGLAAASFWLATSQTLLDAHYPIRPNMALLTFLLVYIVREAVRLRNLEKGGFRWLGIGLALAAAIFTHEFALLFVPLIAVFFILEWNTLKRHALPAAVACLSAWAVYLASLFWILPPLAGRVVGRWPPMDWMTGGLEPLLADPLVIFPRLRDFALVGVREMINQNLGAGENLPFYLRLFGPAAAVLMLFSGGIKYLRFALKPLLPAVLYFLAVALFMFPVIPATVEMPVYYYSTIIILFILPLGAFLSASFSGGKRWRTSLACLSLLVIGLLNYTQSSRVLDELPSAFGFNDEARLYTRDLLGLPPLLRAADALPVPVYTAYHRPRVFDISRRWDIMLRVWNHEPEQLFSMLLPVVNLRLYERGYLIGEPEEFLALSGRHSGEYQSRAGVYWDLPGRRVYDLERIRASALEPEETPLIWKEVGLASDSREVRGEVVPGLLGERQRTALPPGEWELPFLFPEERIEALTVFFAVRADLMPPGPDDVMERVIPLPLRSCRVSVKNGSGGKVFAEDQTFGWSWQLFKVRLPSSENGWRLAVESEADFEVLGPVFVSVSEDDAAWSREFKGDISLLAF